MRLILVLILATGCWSKQKEPSTLEVAKLCYKYDRPRFFKAMISVLHHCILRNEFSNPVTEEDCGLRMLQCGGSNLTLHTPWVTLESLIKEDSFASERLEVEKKLEAKIAEEKQLGKYPEYIRDMFVFLYEQGCHKIIPPYKAPKTLVELAALFYQTVHTISCGTEIMTKYKSMKREDVQKLMHTINRGEEAMEQIGDLHQYLQLLLDLLEVESADWPPKNASTQLEKLLKRQLLVECCFWQEEEWRYLRFGYSMESKRTDDWEMRMEGKVEFVPMKIDDVELVAELDRVWKKGKMKKKSKKDEL